MKTFKEFVHSINEGIAFEHDPRPHVVTRTQDRFGRADYDVTNRHDWRGEVIKSHRDAESARDHADALNKAHREKHGITESLNEARSRGTGFPEHDAAAKILKKHDSHSVHAEGDHETDPSHIHLGAVHPSKIEKLHKDLTAAGFKKQAKPEKAYYGTHSGDRRIDKYHHFTKGDTHVIVAHHPNTFGNNDENGDNDHHQVEVVTHKAGGELH